MFTELNSNVERYSPMTMLGPANVHPTTVLLVDDDDQLRTFCRDCLAENGFRVLEGDNGLEALLVAANHDGAIDVLIADLEMPRIRGTQLAHVFKAMWPTISVLFISGSPVEPIRADLDSDCAFLPKPFLPDALLKTIGEVLDARSTPRQFGTISSSVGFP
jgi:two-component system, cell cycle sensor histidine kinase and response regulator CckA